MERIEATPLCVLDFCFDEKFQMELITEFLPFLFGGTGLSSSC